MKPSTGGALPAGSTPAGSTPAGSTPAGSTPAGSTPEAILAIDPGKDKCGLAVVAVSGVVLWRQIAPPSHVLTLVAELQERFSIRQIVLGNATTSRAMREKLQREFPHLEVMEVEEKNSTLEARALYWKQNPPRGWRRVLPLSAQMPPEPVDDFAAVVLAQRFWKCREKANP